MNNLKKKDIDFFLENGYLAIGKIIDDDFLIEDSEVNETDSNDNNQESSSDESSKEVSEVSEDTNVEETTEGTTKKIINGFVIPPVKYNKKLNCKRS